MGKAVSSSLWLLHVHNEIDGEIQKKKKKKKRNVLDKSDCRKLWLIASAMKFDNHAG